MKVNEEQNIGDAVLDRETEQTTWTVSGLGFHRVVGSPLSVRDERGKIIARKIPNVEQAYLMAAAPALYAELEAIKSALGFIEWSSPEHAEEILDHTIKKYYPRLRAALDLVKAPAADSKKD